MITDRKARSIKPDSKAISSGITGLILRPTATPGRGQWILRYVSPATGKRRQTSLGVFPDVPVKAALDAGRDARQLLAAGTDPIEIKQQQDAIPTFEAAARERWEAVQHGFSNAKHRRDWINSLQLHVFPTIGQVRVDKLQPADFERVLQPIWLSTPETARRVKQRCSDVMATCWARGQVQGNPVDVVDRLLPKQSDKTQHQPAMPWQMLPEFVDAQLRREPLLGARACLLWLILTACRSGEARGTTWREIDLDAKLWELPAERMKAREPHRVPLSDAAVELLQHQAEYASSTAPGALVFPSLRGKQLSDMALTSLLRKSKAPSDAESRTATAHGFRSSFRNWAADHGYSNDIAERALAHQIANKVQAAYERTDRLEARVDLMEHWARHVMAGADSNVVAIAEQRA